MIEVIVHYGNHNKYKIELPSSTRLGLLSWYLTKIIDLNPEDVLYMIMGGCIIGGTLLPFSKTLAECNIINNRCVVSLVFRDKNINYPDADLYIMTRNLNWIQRHINSNNSAGSTQSIGSTIPMDMATFFQAIGIDPTTLTDVAVTIPEDEYESYVTRLSSPVTDPCSVCSSEIPESEGVALGCGHAFHDHCIREWLTTRAVRCPSCNYDIRTDRDGA